MSMRMIIICIFFFLIYILIMILDYYRLPFGAQLLLWTSRIIINKSCRTFPNKYDLVDKAYKKVGLNAGLFLLKDLLSYMRRNKDFRLQSICSRKLILNELDLINCVEENKYADFDNYYYIKLWSIKNNIDGFCSAAQKLSISFKNLNLDTNIKTFKSNKILPSKNRFNNITMH